jgi:hypothetical protein
MPAAMKPRLVSRIPSKGTPLVGDTGIDGSLSSVYSPPAPYTVLGYQPERNLARIAVNWLIQHAELTVPVVAS